MQAACTTTFFVKSWFEYYIILRLMSPAVQTKHNSSLLHVVAFQS